MEAVIIQISRLPEHNMYLKFADFCKAYAHWWTGGAELIQPAVAVMHSEFSEIRIFGKLPDI